MIKLVGPYYLDFKPLNYILCYRRDAGSFQGNKAKDKYAYDEIGYLTSLSGVLNAIKYHAGVNTPPEIKSIEGVVSRLEDIVLKASDNDVVEQLLENQDDLNSEILGLMKKLRDANKKIEKLEGNNG